MTMTDEMQQSRRDPLVEHVVPLLAKAMASTQDTEELWGYLHERVEVECRRMEDDAAREALEPLRIASPSRRWPGSPPRWRSRPSQATRRSPELASLAGVGEPRPVGVT